MTGVNIDLLSEDLGAGGERAAAAGRPDSCDGRLEQCISALRARVGTEDMGGTGLSLVSELVGAVDSVREERDGLAGELIGVYEQLGVVFDVTSRLATVRTEGEVLSLIVDALQRSFQRDEVFILPPRSDRRGIGSALCGEGPGWWLNSSDVGWREWINDLADRLRHGRSAVVETVPEGICPPHFREILLGPIHAASNSSDPFVGAISIARRAGGDKFRASDMLLVESLTQFCGDLIRSHRLLFEVGEISVAMVQALVNAVDQKDPYTSGHSLRVGFYSTLLGNKVGLSGNDLQMLQWSALLHDVGKIGIRDEVLKKAGRLTEEEFSHIKEHPVRSYNVVRKVAQLSAALDGVLHHHERYDGSGYPSGLAGEAIPLQARIVQVADVFDALTSSRSYRQANDWLTALDIMEHESGTTLDPSLCRTFDELIRSAVAREPGGWEGLTERANRVVRIGPQHSEAAGGK